MGELINKKILLFCYKLKINLLSHIFIINLKIILKISNYLFSAPCLLFFLDFDGGMDFVKG